MNLILAYRVLVLSTRRRSSMILRSAFVGDFESLSLHAQVAYEERYRIIFHEWRDS